MRSKRVYLIICIAITLLLLAACSPKQGENAAEYAAVSYSYEEYPLENDGLHLHLDCVKTDDADPGKNILLIHGVTYSSHEFDVDYLDYSLVKKLAREGYAVWRLDIAGFGRSDQVEDGFLLDSDHAADDIDAAVEMIVRLTGREKIDLLGWSWGTVTVGRYAAKHTDRIRKLVLYAPILCGIGEYEVTEAFHHNSWEHASDDFQRDQNGKPDYSIVDPIVLEVFCSNCWHYDGEQSPNGGRRDICVSASVELIDLSKITVQTMIICGDKDPYLNYSLIDTALKKLPEGSKLEMIKGGSHVVYIEKPYYHEFQEKLISFLK